jgi:hypothetical protein
MSILDTILRNEWGQAMHRSSGNFHLPIVFAILFGLAFSASASEIDESRSAYIAALVDAMRLGDQLGTLSAAARAAEDDLSAVRDLHDRALTAALVGPQANLLAAKEAVLETGKSTALEVVPQPGSEPLRISQLMEEAARLEDQRKEIRRAADDRLASAEDLQAKAEIALKAKDDALKAFDSSQTGMVSLKTNKQNLAELQTLATTAAGLRDPKLRDYVWERFSPSALINQVRTLFRLSVLELIEKDDFAQGRLAVSRYDRWNFNDVPRGEAWLLWDATSGAPFVLKLPNYDVFEQPTFLRVSVSGNTEVNVADLERIDMDNVDESLWSVSVGSAYDACLERLSEEDEGAATRQICQALFLEDARFDVTVLGVGDGRSEAYLLSGVQARAFAELYRSHLSQLHDLAIGEVPVVLLEDLQRVVTSDGNEAVQQVTTALNLLSVAKANLDKANSDLIQIQQAQSDTIAFNRAASAEDDTTEDAIALRLTAIQSELTALKAEGEREAAALKAEAERKAAAFVIRQAAAAYAVTQAEKAIETARLSVAQDWASRLAQAEKAAVAAREAIDKLQGDHNARSTTNSERKRFLDELARGKIERRVYFKLGDYVNEICLSIQNKSDHYVVLRRFDLLFRGQPFSQIALLDAISDGEYIFDTMKRFGGLHFENKYSEPVAGLKPNHFTEQCSYIEDPRTGELGRYFDNNGGFSETDWDVSLDVTLGTFNNTEKSIKRVPSDVIFADDLKAAGDAASVAYPQAASTSEILPHADGLTEAVAERAPEESNQTAALPSPDVPNSGSSADDKVIEFDRVMGLEVQAALNVAGFNVGQPDGLIGKRSQTAISDWQVMHGFSATGALTRGQAAELLGHPLP